MASLCIDLNYKLSEHPRDLTRDQISFLMICMKLRNESLESTQLAEEGVTRIVFSDNE